MSPARLITSAAPALLRQTVGLATEHAPHWLYFDANDGLIARGAAPRTKMTANPLGNMTDPE